MCYDFFRFLFGGESFKQLDPRIEKTLYIFACTNSVMDPIVYGFFNLRKSQNTTSSRHQVRIRTIKIFGGYELLNALFLDILIAYCTKKI